MKLETVMKYLEGIVPTASSLGHGLLAGRSTFSCLEDLNWAMMEL